MRGKGVKSRHEQSFGAEIVRFMRKTLVPQQKLNLQYQLKNDLQYLVVYHGGGIIWG